MLLFTLAVLAILLLDISIKMVHYIMNWCIRYLSNKLQQIKALFLIVLLLSKQISDVPCSMHNMASLLGNFSIWDITLWELQAFWVSIPCNQFARLWSTMMRNKKMICLISYSWFIVNGASLHPNIHTGTLHPSSLHTGSVSLPSRM